MNETTGYLLKLLQKSQQIIIKKRGEKKEQGLENKHVESVLPSPTALHTPTLSYIPPPFRNAPLMTNRELEHYSLCRSIGSIH